MKFHKYQALGNDFIIVNEDVTSKEAKTICDRHFGVGADGILVHYKSQKADAGMKIINSDGSLAVMCGNGLRCFCSYLVNDCDLSKNPILVETGRGVLEVSYKKAEEGFSVEANLGKPELMNGGFFEFSSNGVDCKGVGISMGNPHLVVFPLTKINERQAKEIADEVQKNNRFGIELNVEVVTGIDKMSRSISMIVKERGAGFTLGCGTGGAAIIEGMNIDGIIKDDLWSMTFPGGTAQYYIKNGEVIMTGIPKKVFSGQIKRGCP